MDNDSQMEESIQNELDCVREQLKTYQLLNADLSKKVQEYKIALTATNKELIALRNEQMAEKLKSSELRRTLNIVNMQVTDFFNSYVRNLQKCMERTDLELTMPQDIHTQQSQGESSSAIVFRPTRIQQPVDMDIPNLLNTILEESAVEDAFNGRHSLVSSTPQVQSGHITEEDEGSITPIAPQPQTPNRSPQKRSSLTTVSFATTATTSRRQSSEPTRPQRRRAIEESSLKELEVSLEEEIPRVNKRRQNVETSSEDELDRSLKENAKDKSKVNTRRQNVVTSSEDELDVSLKENRKDKSHASSRRQKLVTSSDDEMDRSLKERKNNSRVNTRRQNISVDLTFDEESRDESSVSTPEMSASQIPLKEVHVNVTKLQTTPNTVDRYQKIFNNESSPPLEGIDEDPVGDDVESDQDDRENRGTSVSSTTTSTSYATTASTNSTTSKKSRKRKAAEIPRRSTGRPKRKARLIVKSLAEGKLNSKLRRSK